MYYVSMGIICFLFTFAQASQRKLSPLDCSSPASSSSFSSSPHSAFRSFSSPRLSQSSSHIGKQKNLPADDFRVAKEEELKNKQYTFKSLARDVACDEKTDVADMALQALRAIKIGDHVTLQELVGEGMNFNWRLQPRDYPYPINAASAAIIYKRAGLLPLILEHADSATMYRENLSVPLPVHYAVQYGDEDALLALYKYGADMKARCDIKGQDGEVLLEGALPAHWAVFYKQKEMLPYLVVLGSSLTEPSLDDFTPLELAEILKNTSIQNMLKNLLKEV